MNGRDSLDYGAVLAVANAQGFELDNGFFNKLTAFEDEVLALWNKDDTRETDEEYEQGIKKAMEKFSDGE